MEISVGGIGSSQDSNRNVLVPARDVARVVTKQNFLGLSPLGVIDKQSDNIRTGTAAESPLWDAVPPF